MSEKHESGYQSRTKEGVTGGRSSAVRSAFSTGQGITQQESEGIGIQGSEFHDQSFSIRGDRSKRDRRLDCASDGEVLEHLASLEEKFYEYVHAHQERLDARRNESKKAEEEFREEVELLKEKIRLLLSRTDTTL